MQKTTAKNNKNENKNQNEADELAQDLFESLEANEADDNEEILLEEEPTAEQAVAQAANEEIAALRDQMLRLAADFDNYRKRSIREQQDIRDYGISSLLEDLLPVIDNLDRALAHAEGEQHPIVQGIRLVAKQFADTLARHGVVGFDSKGAVFDPERHEAVSQVPTADFEPGMILDEVQRGYLLKNRLLRAAKVVVASTPPKPVSNEADNQDDS